MKHDWKNFNNVSFESILIMLHEIYMVIVIHLTACSQHYVVSGFCFFWDALFRRKCAKLDGNVRFKGERGKSVKQIKQNNEDLLATGITLMFVSFVFSSYGQIKTK